MAEQLATQRQDPAKDRSQPGLAVDSQAANQRRNIAVRLVIPPLGLAILLVCWSGYRSYQSRRLRSELQLAERDFAAQRFAAARDRLARLAQAWPGRGEVEYWLGVCELNQGHARSAMEAWSRVPDQSAEAPQAALARGKLASEGGAHALAEACLDRASRATGEVGGEARRMLEQVYWITGRYDDYRRLVRRAAELQPDPSGSLRSLWAVDNDPYPLEGMMRLLDAAGGKHPDDDRVWLARAYLETSRGRFDEAGSLLARCAAARPDDQVVWQARLEWAQAADRPDELLSAAAHLPAARFSRSQILAVIAWMASRGVIATRKKRLWRNLSPGIPAISPAWSAWPISGPKMAIRSRLPNGGAARPPSKSREQYRALVNEPDLPARAADLARRAELIGRRFDARLVESRRAPRSLSRR